MTPVAELSPVDLAGSTIARATLHNFDYIIKQGINIGDTVVVEKGGDVIPKVTSVNNKPKPKPTTTTTTTTESTNTEENNDNKELKDDKKKSKKTKKSKDNNNNKEKEKEKKEEDENKLTTAEFEERKRKIMASLNRNEKGELICPCGERQPLTTEVGKIDYFCTYILCPEQKVAKLAHFTSKKAMDIDGFSDKTIEKLIQNDIIDNIIDLYNLKNKKSELLTMEGMGIAKVNNLLNVCCLFLFFN